ncbi:TadE family protein [Vibrio alfacsensis]|uniref:TadE/TadG family type IV pilus assembly protein n=1 Tax=Vibrio alfacsensis TaxID=1074311 RepID=UPI002ADD6166|nr:TadE family protein [Vibrio alfacsensis]WQE76243.1 TadE family protein [Vibrio alfacsensis]
MKVKSQRGVASVEFAIGFFAFWLMCMAWVEMSYMSYVSAINDLAISEISRTAKKSSDDYMDIVQEVLHRENSIWNQVIDGDHFKVSIQYLDNIGDLTDFTGQCDLVEEDLSKECGEADSAAIAVYHIDYAFQPIFSYFLGLDGLMSREMLVVQEYERSQFEI